MMECTHILSLALVYRWVFPSGNTHQIKKRNACLRNRFKEKRFRKQAFLLPSQNGLPCGHLLSTFNTVWKAL